MLKYSESRDVMDDHFIECERFWVREFKKQGMSEGIELTIKAHEKALSEVPMEDPRSPAGEAIDTKARKDFIEWKTEVLRRYNVTNEIDLEEKEAGSEEKEIIGGGTMEFEEFEALVKDKSDIFNAVSSEGWRMDKDFLINVVKELDYALYQYVSKAEYAEIQANAMKALKELSE